MAYCWSDLGKMYLFAFVMSWQLGYEKLLVLFEGIQYLPKSELIVGLLVPCIMRRQATLQRIILLFSGNNCSDIVSSDHL